MHKDGTVESYENVPENVIDGHGGEKMGTWQCIRENPKVVFWTLYANLGAMMIGYDNLTLAVCLSMPAFQKVFAIPVNGHPVIPAYWQSLWNAMFNIMTMIGSFSSGQLQDLMGRRFVFGVASIIAIAGIAVNFIAATPGVFLAGKMVTGLAIGLILSGAQTYVSEITPLPMRGIALSTYTISLNLGMLIAISSTFSRIDIMDPSAFRVLFASAWVFPTMILIGLPFMPESPYHLVQKSNIPKAKRMLQRLSNSRTDIQSQLNHIVTTVEAERALAAETEKASFLDCFRGVEWRRTRIILICNYMPQVVGATLSANAPYFLNQTGMASHTVIMLIQVGISFGVASAILNIYLMMKLSHRPLMFFGVTLDVALFLVMGIAGCFKKDKNALLAVGIALQITPWSYGPVIGPSMAMAGEVSSTRLRAKSLAIGTAFNYLASTVWTIVLPYLFNSDQANLGGKVGFIFFGMAIVALVVLFYDAPETKGRSFDELDVLFEQRVSARKFKGYDAQSTGVELVKR